MSGTFGPCCTNGDCCGPGSYCCANTGPHTHSELDNQEDNVTTTTRLQRLRDVQSQIATNSTELAVLKNQKLAHPDRPKSGKRPSQFWLTFCREWEQDRTKLLKRNHELVEELNQVRQEFSQDPVSTWSLGRILDRLVTIEATFEEQGEEVAWDKLTKLIDDLEAEERNRSTK